MAETLLSMGLDVGTSTTQMVISRLIIENKASCFSVPEMEISKREIIYKSPIHFTPLSGDSLVDGDQIRHLVEQEYAIAGIRRNTIDTGAVIITGESSRKTNARTVLEALSQSSGEFVVATAGPHLESRLAAMGAGADRYSEEHCCSVLHIDIGGGTSNLALLENGKIVATGCLNVGGRLLKLDGAGTVVFRSAVLENKPEIAVGTRPSIQEIKNLCSQMVQALEMAAGLRPPTRLLQHFWTEEAGNPWLPPQNVDVISFSGGVAECIAQEHSPFQFGDIGPILGQAIRQSRLCAGKVRLNQDAIRATVIGAGSHSAQLSGSTVFFRGVEFPMKNLPVIHHLSQIATTDEPVVLALPTIDPPHYQQIIRIADEISENWPAFPVIIALETDMAKALGHALALRLPPTQGILCIDRVKPPVGSFLDVGQPVASALPVIVKTLILNQ